MTPTGTTPSVATLAGVQHDVLLKSFQAIAIGLVLALIAGILHMGMAPYITFAFAGALVMHVVAKPSWKELAASFGLGAVFAALYFTGHGTMANYRGAEIGWPGGFAGMG